VAVADTSDGFYSSRGGFVASLAGRDSDETDRRAWCLFARQFSELALRDPDRGTEWIDTKPRSFDTDTRDPFEETS
jgi:hypothetical protein